MQRSLLNQFRGAYLGAALGDVLIVRRLQPESPLALPLGAIALAHTQTLLGTPHALSCVGEGWDQQQLTPLQAMAIQVAMSVPAAVYFHDDVPEFQRQMRTQRDLGYPIPVAEAASEMQLLDDALLLLALVISGILQQHEPTAAIASLRAGLEQGNSPLLVRGLACLEEQLEQRYPLAIAHVQLKSVLSPDTPAQSVLFALVLSLYIVFSSLSDFPLTLRRSQHLVTLAASLPCTLQRLVSFVVGLMSGAYNGLEGIPLTWRHCLTPGSYHQLHAVSPELLEAYWSIGSEIELLQLVDSLFAGWAGADDFSRFLGTASLVAIASPTTAQYRFP